MNQKKLIFIGIILIIVIGIGCFYAGMKYQQTQRRGQFLGQFNGQPGRNGQFPSQFGQGARAVRGEIIASDDKSITVKLSDGSSKIVLLSDSASINKAAQGSKEDLKTGEQVIIFGKENSDGSVTAQSIQLGQTPFLSQPPQR